MVLSDRFRAEVLWYWGDSRKMISAALRELEHQDNELHDEMENPGDRRIEVIILLGSCQQGSSKEFLRRFELEILRESAISRSSQTFQHSVKDNWSNPTFVAHTAFQEAERCLDFESFGDEARDKTQKGILLLLGECRSATPEEFIRRFEMEFLSAWPSSDDDE